MELKSFYLYGCCSIRGRRSQPLPIGGIPVAEEKQYTKEELLAKAYEPQRLVER